MTAVKGLPRKGWEEKTQLLKGEDCRAFGRHLFFALDGYERANRRLGCSRCGEVKELASEY